MKYKCELIRDLIPLYIDDVCSEESRKAVEEHLNDCGECRELYSCMSSAEEMPVDESFEKKQTDSLMKVRKKQKKSSRILLTAGIIIGLIPALVFGGVIYDMMYRKPSVCTDISAYSYCLDREKDGQFFLNEKKRRIFPEKITEKMMVTDFKYVHYNPWDPQIIIYLTVEYSDEDYKTELKRLSDIGIEPYEDIYSVSGEPVGYDLAAMDSDEYYGFVYAMIPENENNSVTYSAIMFCNYILDADINEFMPKKYLLKDFNADDNNEYRRKMMSSHYKS